jgi:hypothetical protein
VNFGLTLCRSIHVLHRHKACMRFNFLSSVLTVSVRHCTLGVQLLCHCVMLRSQPQMHPAMLSTMWQVGNSRIMSENEGACVLQRCRVSICRRCVSLCMPGTMDCAVEASSQ